MKQSDMFWYLGTRSEKRMRFLTTLASTGPGRNVYKPYTQSPLRYAGGKSRAVGNIISSMPQINRIVSPFVGGGSVEVALAREMGVEVVGYDVFGILCNYWDVQINQANELADMLEEWEPTKAKYAAVKMRLKEHWEGEKEITDNVDLAAHYWFNHNLSYGPSFLGWMSKIYMCPKRYQRMVAKVRNFSAGMMHVRQESFEVSIPTHNVDFLYCDPPYYLDGDSKMFVGMYPQRNFPIHHKGFDHEKLRDLLLAHPTGFLLSYNDCSTIREWYASCIIKEVKWQYTMGQGETRIGKNRKQNNTDHVKKSHELLIYKEGK